MLSEQPFGGIYFSIFLVLFEYHVSTFIIQDQFGERNDDSHSLGDWEPNKEKFPNGIKLLAEKINDTGMLFGIWVEPEMINVESDLYRRHQDWAMSIRGRLHSEGRNQRVLDLANPAVRGW